MVRSSKTVILIQSNETVKRNDFERDKDSHCEAFTYSKNRQKALVAMVAVGYNFFSDVITTVGCSPVVNSNRCSEGCRCYSNNEVCFAIVHVIELS